MWIVRKYEIYTENRWSESVENVKMTALDLMCDSQYSVVSVMIPEVYFRVLPHLSQVLNERRDRFCYTIPQSDD